MARPDANMGAALIAIAIAIASVALSLPGIAPAQESRGDLASVQGAPESHEGHLAAARAVASDPLGDIVVEFQLTDRDGNLVSAEDFRGRYVLLGFGFTHCPAVCPLMVLNMGKALRDTETDAAGIFVSVDTERDSPAATDDYASKFGERMMGLGGSIEQINTAASNFKVSYAVTKTQNNYTVQHTANVFVIDPRGELADVFTFSTPAETLMEALR